ncbi:MAG: hypothetical protein JWR51_4613 [Devosia sp.]|uniref:hypothetical protein n=1 Tax=Devosia sp. TaxID=1871048 RepID=UPI002628C524|nr:hypothetical protein [Devosia sp.]MDB5531510.1 hypothetical protein [Devosia sp.]
MYSRFGMSYIAVEAAQARMRAAQLQEHNNQRSEARAAVLSAAHDDDVGALWRMGAVIVVILALVGTFAWFV